GQPVAIDFHWLARLASLTFSANLSQAIELARRIERRCMLLRADVARRNDSTALYRSHEFKPDSASMSSVPPTASSLPQARANHGLLEGAIRWIADLGEVMIAWVAALGDIMLFSWRTMVWMFSRMPRRDTLLPNFYQIGVLSLPVVALTGTFIGMVLAVQSYDQFKQMRLETQLGAGINKSMGRELGPVLAGTMVVGRGGSGMGGGLGSVEVTDKSDA